LQRPNLALDIKSHNSRREIMSFLVEQLSVNDIDECTTIVASMAKEMLPSETDRDSVRRIISDANVLTLVAKKNKRIVAMISGTCQASLNITFLIVSDEESARHGVGSLLIDNFEEIGKKRSPASRYVTTSLVTDNTAAVALYSAKGYEVGGFLKEALGAKDLIILRKKL